MKGQLSGNPSGGDWTIWCKAIAPSIRRIKSLSRSTAGTGSMENPPDTWRWFHSDNDDRLYYRSAPNVWQFCIRHPRRQRNYVFKNQLFNISNSDLPDDLRRTVISRSGQLIFAFGSARDEWRDLPATLPTTFEGCLMTLPKEAQWALRDINLTDGGLTIAQAIRDGTAIGISDGSFKHGWWMVPQRVTVYAGTILSQATRRIKFPIAADSQACTGLHWEHTPSANSRRLIKVTALPHWIEDSMKHRTPRYQPTTLT
jgi:hypothetical protein